MEAASRRTFIGGGIAAAAAVGGVAAGALSTAAAAEPLAAAADVPPHPLAGLTMNDLVERYGEREVLEALGIWRQTKAATEMDNTTALLMAHMHAMNGISTVDNMPLASGVEDELQAMQHWHYVQAQELVTKLRRMGWGDGSSASCARRGALLQWHADFDGDAEDILILLQAEEEIEDRMTALTESRPYKGRSVHSWAEDLQAGVRAGAANDEVKRDYHREVEAKFKRREEFGIFADLVGPYGQVRG